MVCFVSVGVSSDQESKRSSEETSQSWCEMFKQVKTETSWWRKLGGPATGKTIGTVTILL